MKKLYCFILAAFLLAASCSAKNSIQRPDDEKAKTDDAQKQEQNIESVIKGSLDENGRIVITHFNFEGEEIEISEESEETVKALAGYLKENTSVTMNVACYTDNDGSPAYCIALSKKRAEFLSEKFKLYGIGEDRINFSGEGWNEEKGESLEIEILR